MYGAIELNRPINSDRDVFGRTFETKIAGVNCAIHTPSIVGNPTGTGEVVGPPFGDDVWPVDRWWGNVGQLMDRPVLLKALGIAVGDDVSLGETMSIADAIGEWERLLFDWLSVLVSKPFELIGTSVPVVSWRNYPPDQFSAWSRLQRPHTVNEPGVAEFDHWARALNYASEGEEAPLGRVMLVEAARSLESKRWRPVVLDCSTATEIVLRSVIYRKLRQNAEHEEVEARMNKVRMLGRLVSFAEEIGLAVPGRIKVDLVDVRNRVMHEGSRVDGNAALAAWVTAREVIEQYEPLGA